MEKQICKPKEYAIVAGICQETGRKHFREWKNKDGIELKRKLTFEFVSDKSGIPLVNFNEVRDYDEFPDDDEHQEE